MAALPRSSVVVHYAEIGTKGNNRAYFEHHLERNLTEKLEPLGKFKVELVDQRLIVSKEDDPEDWRDAMAVLKDVFGVAWLAEVVECPLDYEGVKRAAVEEMEALKQKSNPSTFRVTAKRSNKSYELTSQQMAVKLGEDLMKGTGLGVDLSNPQATLFVDILSDRVLLHTEKERGPGGLPVGVTGKVVHLLSGGIDSPVAAWLMMKRGCDLTYVHFFVAPSAEEILETKMARMLKALSKFGIGGGRLVLVPFTEYQVATADLRPEYEPVVFRHFMRIVAEKVANRVGALAISTGDNLAQVASQTLYNIACIDAGASMPTLRPVVGYDKSEIVRLAETIGTYEDSIADYKDCCSIVSRHPRTRMNVEAILEASLRYDFPALAERTLSQAATMRLDSHSQILRVEPLEAPTVKERI
ncbi:MAG TPA: tRNA uracil 4-sulfurtransferase ThiI [Nitrososphaerales archaeon]|nr:tRNA uracil 4-sulfurtransferase ThiI [Nitrososphaerales archaeon]